MRTEADANVTGHTTGGRIWQAARHAVAFFERMQHDAGLSRPGVRVLELGAGCGLLGLALAANLPHAAEVCLTEQPGLGLAHLRRNLQLNAPLLGGRARACACDWRDYADCRGSSQAEQAPAEPAAARPTGEQAPAAPAEPAAARQEEQAPPQASQRASQQRQQQEEGGAAGASSSSSSPPGGEADGADGADGAASRARLLSTSWDLIVGSDLVYNEASGGAPPRCFTLHLRTWPLRAPGPCAHLAPAPPPGRPGCRYATVL